MHIYASDSYKKTKGNDTSPGALLKTNPAGQASAFHKQGHCLDGYGSWEQALEGHNKNGDIPADMVCKRLITQQIQVVSPKNCQQQDITRGFPTHRRPYGFRSFSSTKMSFSRQRNVIFSHVDVRNRVLKISKTTSFFDISSCFFWDAALFFLLLRSASLLLTALQSSSRNRWGANGPKDFRQQ